MLKRQDYSSPQDLPGAVRPKNINPANSSYYPHYRGVYEWDSFGCYGGGTKFEDMHGMKAKTDYAEIRRDIVHTCSMAAGTQIEKGSSDWWGWCSEWRTDDGTNDGANSIYWEISRYDTHKKKPDKNYPVQIDTLTFAVCNATLHRELGGCEHGSEQTGGLKDDGWWWFRIDPSEVGVLKGAGESPRLRGIFTSWSETTLPFVIRLDFQADLCFSSRARADRHHAVSLTVTTTWRKDAIFTDMYRAVHERTIYVSVKE